MRALITGITGQDGAYLAQLLLGKGYEVLGGLRRTSSINDWRLRQLGIADDIQLVNLEMTEPSNIRDVIKSHNPDEVYNLAAQSFVGVSFEQPIYTTMVDGLAVTYLLEAIREVNRDIRFYQASTSEMFGKVVESPQSERTPFYPRSPYGVAKVYAHWMTVNAREAHGLHASSGILFNHESPLRGREFVTRKITHGLSQFKLNGGPAIELGNLDAERDWGFAGDYVNAMWRMTQAKEGGSYVVATGQTHTVRDFVNAAANVLDLPLEWDGTGENERARHARSGDEVVRVNREFFRPAEVNTLLGDATRAKRDLGWVPQVSFSDLVGMMVQNDLARLAPL